jgi:hypothetical protein
MEKSVIRKIAFVMVIISLFVFAGAGDFLYFRGSKSEAAQKADSDDEKQEKNIVKDAPERSLPKLEPGRWEVLFEIGKGIYPSVIISTATLKAGLWEDEDKQHLGDRWGIIGVAVRGTKNDCPVKVEISGDSFIKPGVYDGSLADKDTIYCVYPYLKYDYNKLVRVKQPIPETLNFKVKIGDRSYPEKRLRVQVYPINECVYIFVDSSGGVNDVSYFLAAYVNENHPFINQILKEAMLSNKVDSFAGYSDGLEEGAKESVTSEIEAIWAALQARGIRYSGMPPGAEEGNPYLESQHIRLLGESINYTQANCVDGSVMMASIFRKIGLNTRLVTVPGHCFVGVSLDKEGKDYIYIETTDLGQTSFEQAVEDGNEEYSKGKGRFDSDKKGDEEYHIVDIQDARSLGIMPIKDAGSTKIVDKGSHPTVIKEEGADTGEDE